MRIRPSIIAAAAAAALACSSGGAKFNPWIVPQQQFFGRVRVIALLPVQMPSDLTNPAPVAARYDSLIQTSLTAAGYDVIPSSVAGPIMDSAKTRVGGLFDPVTGKRDTARITLVYRAAFRALADRGRKADAVLSPHIVHVLATVVHDDAQWDGTSEHTTSLGHDVLMGLFGGPAKFGTLGALSLAVFVDDSLGDPMYVNQGGIQLSSRPEGKRIVQIPRSSLFTDPDRDVKAVRIALQPLLAGQRPAAAVAAQ